MCACGRATPGRTGSIRSRVKNGFRIAWHERRIMILLLMVAAVTVAADPIWCSARRWPGRSDASAAWSGIFIAALGGGNVIGSFRRTRRTPSIRRAATVLASALALHGGFRGLTWIWISAAAAFGGGHRLPARGRHHPSAASAARGRRAARPR